MMGIESGGGGGGGGGENKNIENKSENIWLHMSCSLFIPELFFKDDKKYTGINRIDLIDKKRFNL
jgi:hypothetical protein